MKRTQLGRPPRPDFESAVISTQGPFTLTNSTVTGNSATSGGALRVSNGQVTITGSVLHDNHATGSDLASGGWGGAILLGDATNLTITDSELYSNTALLGGALHNAFAGTSM